MFTLAIGDLFIPDRLIGIPTKFRKLLAPNPANHPSNPKIAQVLCLGNITQSQETLEFLHNISNSFHIVQGEFDDPNIVSQQLAHVAADPSLPQYKVLTVDNFRIGFTNGHQIVPRNEPLSLLAFAREIDVDILIWGGTHRVEAYTLDGKYFINPGSATGAFHFGWPENDEAEDAEEEDVKSEKDESENKEVSEGKEEAKKDENVESNEKKEVLHEEAIEDALNEPIPSFCLLETQGSMCTLYIYTYINDEVKVDKVIYRKD